MLSLRRLVAALLSLILLTSARTELYTSIIHKFPQPPHPQKTKKKSTSPVSNDTYNVDSSLDRMWSEVHV